MYNFRIFIEDASAPTEIKTVEVDCFDSIEAACFAASQIFGLPFTRHDFEVARIHNHFHRTYRIAHKRIAAFWIDCEICFIADDDPLPLSQTATWRYWNMEELRKKIETIGKSAFEKEYLGRF